MLSTSVRILPYSTTDTSTFKILFFQQLNDLFAIFFEVPRITVNRHYLCHLYYHDGWLFNIIYIMLHHFRLQRHMKHC